MDPTAVHTYVHSKACTRMFIVVLFLIVLWYKPLTFPSLIECIQNWAHSYIFIHSYSHTYLSLMLLFPSLLSISQSSGLHLQSVTWICSLPFVSTDFILLKPIITPHRIYHNSLFTSLLASTNSPLWFIICQAARIILSKHKSDHIILFKNSV